MREVSNQRCVVVWLLLIRGTKIYACVANHPLLSQVD